MGLYRRLCEEPDPSNRWSSVAHWLDFRMAFLNLEQLPFVGMSYEFHRGKQGAPISAYIVAKSK
jgi:hypothetical protein